MQVTCGDCGASYDDARCWTFCPHDRFISDADAARKDLAYSLLGKYVVFADGRDNTPRRVWGLGATGMINLLEGMSGEFAPDLFMVVEGVDA